MTTNQQLKVKSSGKEDNYDTGAKRDCQLGKGRFDLLPVDAMFRLAKHFENGAQRYEDRNWEKGIPLSRYLDSGLRHFFKVLAGHTDEDHEAAAAWNILCYMQTKIWIAEGKLPEDLDDLPKRENGTQKLESDIENSIKDRTLEILNDFFCAMKDVNNSRKSISTEEFYDDILRHIKHTQFALQNLKE